jgi:two-component system, OmpR family, response regulator
MCTAQRQTMQLRIYLAEDSPVIRDSLIGFLEEDGTARVVGWSAGQMDSLRWLEDNCREWDVAVVDLFLLEGNGLGIVAGCRARFPHQKVVVLTNYATPSVRERCRLSGADAVFDKSTELEEFLAFAQDTGRMERLRRRDRARG